MSSCQNNSVSKLNPAAYIYPVHLCAVVFTTSTLPQGWKVKHMRLCYVSC